MSAPSHEAYRLLALPSHSPCGCHHTGTRPSALRLRIFRVVCRRFFAGLIVVAVARHGAAYAGPLWSCAYLAWLMMSTAASSGSSARALLSSGVAVERVGDGIVVAGAGAIAGTSHHRTCARPAACHASTPSHRSARRPAFVGGRRSREAPQPPDRYLGHEDIMHGHRAVHVKRLLIGLIKH
jgi:hypothetical protein